MLCSSLSKLGSTRAFTRAWLNEELKKKMCVLKCLKSLLYLGVLLMYWMMKPGVGCGHRGRGRWQWSRGKTLVASRLWRTMGEAHGAGWHCEHVAARGEEAHLMGTPASSKATPWHWFYLLSVHDPLIQETNPLNQTGLSCKAWLAPTVRQPSPYWG